MPKYLSKHFYLTTKGRLRDYLENEYLSQLKVTISQEKTLESAYQKFVCSFNSIYASHLTYFLLTSQFGDYYHVQRKDFEKTFQKNQLFDIFDKVNYSKQFQGFIKKEFNKFRKLTARNYLNSETEFIRESDRDIVEKIEELLHENDELCDDEMVFGNNDQQIDNEVAVVENTNNKMLEEDNLPTVGRGGINDVIIEENLCLDNDQNKSEWNMIITSHKKLDIYETKFLEELESFFTDCLEEIIQKLAEDNEGQNKYVLPHIQFFFEYYIKKFLQFIQQFDLQKSNQKHYNSLIKKLEIDKSHIFVRIHSPKIFDLVLQMDESVNVVKEIKYCLDTSNMIEDITTILKEETQRRQLIAGVVTNSIIEQYINTVKTLQILDHDGYYFEKVTTPIKKYLFKRPDVLRCIISLWIEDMEMKNSNANQVDTRLVKIPTFEEQVNELSSDDDEAAAEKWEVHNIAGKKNYKRMRYKESDLMIMLIDLYGSEEAFIQEYEGMLAEKLLQSKNTNVNEERKNIELLKLRFGELKMNRCNVLIKDLEDSMRYDKGLKLDLNSGKYKALPTIGDNIFGQSIYNLSTLVVTVNYWPINYDVEHFKYPPEFKQIFEVYENIYQERKHTRRLIPHNNIGSVDIELDFGDDSYSFTCQPVQAVLISYFDETCVHQKTGKGVSLDFLASQLQAHPNYIRQKMFYWVHSGVVKEEKANMRGSTFNNNFINAWSKRVESMYTTDAIVYALCEGYRGGGDSECFVENEHESISKYNNVNKTSDESENSLQTLILTILNTNGPKTGEKIYFQMKTVYKPKMGVTLTDSDFKEILTQMIRRGKIKLDMGIYYPCV